MTAASEVKARNDHPDVVPMFTGIVTDIGLVRFVRAGQQRVFAIEPMSGKLSSVGNSIACSGVCLTVTGHQDGCFLAQASSETLRASTLSRWRVGTRVNLEPSLKLGAELGGHLVQGHIEGIATVTELHLQPGGSLKLACTIPDHLLRFCAVKGSVALDGVSLTINELEAEHCAVNILPHTLGCTTLGTCRVGELLNLETDVIARYLARLQFRAHQAP